MAGVYSDNLCISVLLTNTRDRVAFSSRAEAPLRRFWRATAPSVQSVRTVDIGRLVANLREEAAEAIRDIVKRFTGDEFSAADVGGVQEYRMRPRQAPLYPPRAVGLMLVAWTPLFRVTH